MFLCLFTVQNLLGLIVTFLFCRYSPSWLQLPVRPIPAAYIHYIQTLDNAHNSQAQGLKLRRGRSLGDRRRVDINDEQTGGF